MERDGRRGWAKVGGWGLLEQIIQILEDPVDHKGLDPRTVGAPCRELNRQDQILFLQTFMMATMENREGKSEYMGTSRRVLMLSR